jgi:hypothetical protein
VHRRGAGGEAHDGAGARHDERVHVMQCSWALLLLVSSHCQLAVAVRELQYVDPGLLVASTLHVSNRNTMDKISSNFSRSCPIIQNRYIGSIWHAHGSGS